MPPAVQWGEFPFVQVVYLALLPDFFFLLLHRSPDSRSLHTFFTNHQKTLRVQRLSTHYCLYIFAFQLQDLDFSAWCQVPSYLQSILYHPSLVSTVSQNADYLRICEHRRCAHESRKRPRSYAPPPHQ